MYSGLSDLKTLITQLNATQQANLLESIFAGERKATPDVDLAPPVVRTIWILLAMSTLVVTTRLAVKYRTTRRLYLDDGLMAIALILAWVHAVFLQVSFNNGLGRHVYYLEPDHRAKKWPIWTFIVLQVLINVTAAILLLSTCGSHLEDLWMLNIGAYFKYCLDIDIQSNYAYFAGAFNTLTDLFLTIQPAILIMHTKMRMGNKVGVASLLCLSIIAMIAAIVRTVAAHTLSDISDYTYDLTPFVTWVSVELNVVLTVTSLPLLRPLARETRERTARLLSINRKIKEPWDDTISLRSMHTGQEDVESKTGAGVGVTALGNHSRDGFASQQDPESVIRTVEVSISYEKNDSPLIHAALVGLVQGQAMERLAGR
ncbi:hypothetical protein D6D27_05720 [Aureobasidium pullulans]|nr:hypothetical protein D6D27_05720 [Aureobasidium pullulans]